MELRVFQSGLIVIFLSSCCFEYHDCGKPLTTPTALGSSKSPSPSAPSVPPGFRYLYDYKIATWNFQSKSNEWKYFARMLVVNNLDVLAIQEAGTIKVDAIPGRIAGPNFSHRIPVILMGLDAPGTQSCFPNMISEYVWSFTIDNVHDPSITIAGNQSYTFYIYVYDCQTNNNGPRTTSLMVLMRERPSRIFVIPSQTPHEATDAADEKKLDKIFPNRPSFGVEFHGNLIFNAHPRPHQHNKKTSSNEAQQLVQSVHNYINTDNTFANYRPTWIMVGDFNKIPTDLGPQINHLNPRVRIVNSGKITHPGTNGQMGRELDYGVAGGEQSTIDRLQAHLYPLDGNNNPTGPSDHIPVVFTASNKRKLPADGQGGSGDKNGSPPAKKN